MHRVANRAQPVNGECVRPAGNVTFVTEPRSEER